jgi:FAD dependent oxidoreductase TIGR03364
MMQPSWDVIVVGAGVLGSFHAYFAARRGLRVLLVERGDWPGEASVRNFGTLMAGAMTPGDWHRRGTESIALYRELAARVPFEFQAGGSLYPATTPGEAAVLEEFARLGPERGYRCELLDPARAAALCPPLNLDHVRLALYFPHDARVEPRGLFRRLIPWMARELNVEYRPATVAVRVTADGGGALVRTADGAELRGRHAVVCSGADLRTLFPERYAAARFQRCKLQMMRTVPQPEVRLPTTLASGLTLRRYPSFRMCPSWAKLEGEPAAPGVLERGIHILMVQDADGSFVVGDSHEYSGGDLDERLDARTEALIVAEARKLARLANWEVAERWHGVYGMPRDAELYRETLGGVIHLVTGIRGKGMTTGPAVASETIDALR